MGQAHLLEKKEKKMKKLMIFAACAMVAAVTQAASVGWAAAGLTGYANDSYQFFVIGQNSVTDIATITALLDAGTSVDSYAFGSGTVTSAGLINQTAAASGKTLDAGTYTSFLVLFDSATPTAGEANYIVLSGTSNQTKTIASTTASVSFSAGNVSSLVNNASNWKSYGAVPEPTSGLLMLLGIAGLALKRKRA